MNLNQPVNDWVKEEEAFMIGMQPDEKAFGKQGGAWKSRVGD